MEDYQIDANTDDDIDNDVGVVEIHEHPNKNHGQLESPNTREDIDEEMRERMKVYDMSNMSNASSDSSITIYKYSNKRKCREELAFQSPQKSMNEILLNEIEARNSLRSSPALSSKKRLASSEYAEVSQSAFKALRSTERHESAGKRWRPTFDNADLDNSSKSTRIIPSLDSPQPSTPSNRRVSRGSHISDAPPSSTPIVRHLSKSTAGNSVSSPLSSTPVRHRWPKLSPIVNAPSATSLLSNSLRSSRRRRSEKMSESITAVNVSTFSRSKPPNEKSTSILLDNIDNVDILNDSPSLKTLATATRESRDKAEVEVGEKADLNYDAMEDYTEQNEDASVSDDNINMLRRRSSPAQRVITQDNLGEENMRRVIDDMAEDEEVEYINFEQDEMENEEAHFTGTSVDRNEDPVLNGKLIFNLFSLV